MPYLWLLTKVGQFVSWGEDTSHIRHCFHAPGVLTTWNLCPLSKLLVVHHTDDTFSTYGIAIPVLSADTKHKHMAHEINLTRVFCFLDHSLPGNGVSYSQSVTQQWAVSQGIQWNFPTPSHPQPPDRTELWKNFSKIVYLPHQLLAHTTCLITECSCLQKGIISSQLLPG